MKNSKKLWIFFTILIVVNLTIYLTHWGGDTILLYSSDLLPVLCSLVSAICLFQTVRKLKELDITKIAWIMIFLGIILYFLAESTYAVLEIICKADMNEMFPSLADYIWCIGYLPVFIGLVIMFAGYLRSGFPMRNIKMWSIIAPLLLLVLSLVIYYLLIPIIKDSETEGLSKFFYLFYPIGDLFIVFPAVILMYITSLFGKGIISKPWRFLALGFICFTFADLLYSYLDWLGKYGSGNMIDLGWNVGYLFIALSGIYQKEMIESINIG